MEEFHITALRNLGKVSWSQPGCISMNNESFNRELEEGQWR
jgi:hypothetical protein